MNRKQDIKEFVELNKIDSYKYPLILNQDSLYERINLTAEQVMFGKGVLEIPSNFYEGIPFKRIIFSNGLKEIGNHAFGGCQIESIYIPNSVVSLGEGLFEGAVIKEIRIPNHLFPSLDLQMIPFINTFVFRDKEVIGRQELSNHDKHLIEQGIACYEDFTAGKINVYVDAESFDFLNLNKFDSINSLHIGKNAYALYGSSYKFQGKFINVIYKAKGNTAFFYKDGVLYDLVNGGAPLYFENKDEIVIDPVFNDPDLYLPINHRHKPKQIYYTHYDVSKNPNYVERSDGIIKHVSSGNTVFIPNKKEIYLYDVSTFEINSLKDHHEIETLIVCSTHNEGFDLASFYYALRRYYDSSEFDLRRKKTLTIVIPTGHKDDKSNCFAYFKHFVGVNPKTHKLVIVYANIEEPDLILE